MGRGRAKAKQRKVARELKYYSPDSDLSALERELRGSSDREHDDDPAHDEYADYEDRWASEDEDDEEDERR